jgi:hypothetical protein
MKPSDDCEMHASSPDPKLNQIERVLTERFNADYGAGFARMVTSYDLDRRVVLELDARQRPVREEVIVLLDGRLHDA